MTLEPSTIDGNIRRSLKRPSGASVCTWNVRYDQEPLASALVCARTWFHACPDGGPGVNGDYERVFAGYSATIRKQIRTSTSPRRAQSGTAR